jgi:hypothetical protein
MEYRSVQSRGIPSPPSLEDDRREDATLKWVDRFNHRRLLEPTGTVPLAVLETHNFRQRSASANQPD